MHNNFILVALHISIPNNVDADVSVIGNEKIFPSNELHTMMTF